MTLKGKITHFNVKFLKGYISTEALSLLSENNRNVILLDTYGKPITFCNGMMDSLTATRYRIGQYDTFRDECISSFESWVFN